MAFQQCGANAAAMTCQGMHDPMRPTTSYVRVIDLATPASRHTGGTTNVGPGESTTVVPGTFFQQVTAQQADLAQPWAGSLEKLQLDFERYINVHAPAAPQTKADLWKAVGK